MGILLTSTAGFPVVIIAIEQLWQLAQRNRVTLPTRKVRMCWSWNCNPGSFLYKAQISEEPETGCTRIKAEVQSVSESTKCLHITSL